MFHPRGPSFMELARQSLASTRRGYDLLAPKFDYTPFRTASPFFQQFTKIWDEAERPARVDRVIDVCCGTGAAIEELHPYCRSHFVGVDFSAGMLRQVRKNLQRRSLDCRVSLVQADFLDLPFRPVFDLALCFGALGHVLRRDETRFLQQIFRCLVPGGRFAFVTHVMPSVLSPVRWAAHAFNTAMRLRNLLLRPPFIMYYLTFLWPDIAQPLRNVGFSVRHYPLFPTSQPPFYYLVVAEKPSHRPTSDQHGGPKER